MRSETNSKMGIGRAMKDLFGALAMISLFLAMVLFIMFYMESKSVDQFISLNQIERGKASTAENWTVNHSTIPKIITLLNDDVIPGSLSIVYNGSTLTTPANYTILSYALGTVNLTAYSNVTAYNDIITFTYDYYTTATAEDNCNQCPEIRSGFNAGEDVIILGLGFVGLIAVVIVFIGFLLPVIQRVF